ncbi:right-handed parallel beta-helix repeat-containing protein [Cellulomonas sp. URHB0016]
MSCVALSAAATLVAAPATAGPPPVCGSTLTVDTRLTADLWCPADGVRLAAGVTLDLGGHTLGGSAGGIGVAVSNEGAVAVRDGTLSGWSSAVHTWAVGGPDATNGPLTVRGVTFEENGVGLDASGESSTGLYVKPTTVKGSTFRRNDLGLSTNWFGRAQVELSTFDGNTIGLFDGGDVDVRRSKFRDNTYGVVVTEASGHIQDSTFTDNRTAVRLNEVGAVTIAGSRFAGSDVAVDGSGWAVDVAGSTFVSNTTGVDVGEYGGAVVRSTFWRNGTTIRLPDMPSGPTLVQDNTFRQNTDGLYVAAGDPSFQIGGNVARANTGWGLHVPGATDLGENRAAANGSVPQCVGVVCAAP